MPSFSKITLKTVIRAGLIAITVNTVLLKSAPVFHIKAESGGLLKLLFKSFPVISSNAFLHSVSFWITFHYITGLAMVMLYFFTFAKAGINKWVKGTLFSFVPWLINSFIVLPVLGQGVLGVHVLPITGIIYFFFANLLFALLLSGIGEVKSDP